ncbi:MAG: hypothetical protein KatS3mg087_0676 [Patescibacteria group bacterium]|nr:MAG: hypothetical protein KatS3mg087_0676 [Patescibacteria group bacterium]
MLTNLLLYLLAFVGIWIGAGIAIHSVEKLSQTLKLSSFAVSFLILGLFTSVSEFSVGVNSIFENDPEIFVGNLIGASIVIFMMIVPLLAITSSSLKISPDFRNHNLPLALFTIATPTLLVLDGVVSRIDSFVSMGIYLFLVFNVQKKKGFFESLLRRNTLDKKQVLHHLSKIILAVGIIFLASNVVVHQTIYFSELLKISPFLISLLFISIGTNIPELSFVVRSAFLKSNQVAFGDYVGSASFNTFLLGLLTLIYNKPIYLNNNYLSSLIFLLVGLVAFYLFARSKNVINRREGLILLLIYAAFLLSEIALSRYAQS